MRKITGPGCVTRLDMGATVTDDTRAAALQEWKLPGYRASHALISVDRLQRVEFAGGPVLDDFSPDGSAANFLRGSVRNRALHLSAAGVLVGGLEKKTPIGRGKWT